MRSLFNRNRPPVSVIIIGSDSSSESSTVSAQQKPSKTSLRRAAGAEHKKSVRFDLSHNECIKAGTCSSKLVTRCWYDKQEIQSMMDSANGCALKIRESSLQSDRTYVLAMQWAWNECAEAADEYQDYHLSAKTEELFQTCVLNSKSRLGLEKSAASHLTAEVESRRAYVLETTFHVQKVLGPGNLQAEMLRRSLEPITRPSRAFAREMGRAQANLPE